MIQLKAKFPLSMQAYTVLPIMLPSCQKQKPAELAYSFLFCSSAYVRFMALSTVFHSQILPTILRFLTLVLRVLSLPYRSYQLFMKVPFNPDTIPGGRLGSKHQLTN